MNPAENPAPKTNPLPGDPIKLIRPYLEGRLSASERVQVESMAQQDARFAEEIRERQWLLQKMEKAYGARALGSDFQEAADRKLQHTTGALTIPPELTAVPAAAALAPLGSRGVMNTLAERFGAAPWWIVSAVLHVLVITLLGLITMAIGIKEHADSVIVLTSLEKISPKALEEERKPKLEARDVLENKRDVAATDPESRVRSEIVVPPDILAKAELGDHFETVNPDRPDTQSAFGNPDARMFHSAQGNDEPEGGGGFGGNGLMDDLIGSGGVSSPGTGGGWGGGNGTGTGLGSGSGHGSFGQRSGGGRKLMVMRHGGSKATESAVDKGLEWLARNQEADGRWDSNKHGGKETDLACSGFALLAFLGAGHTEKIGKYREHVRLAVDWIIKQQQKNGLLKCSGNAGSGTYMGYSHAIAGMALAEAAGMGRIPATKEAAQKAIAYSVEVHQAGDGSEKRGYRYCPKQDPADLSNHGWFVMHLKSAKVAGLNIPHGGIDGAIWFLDQVEDKTFIKKGDDPYDNGRHRYLYAPAHGGSSARLTAIGCLNRQFMGAKKEELQGGVEWFVKVGGVPQKNHVDLYYWYYGTLCTFQQGGDVWKNWNEALKGALLPLQRVGGAEDGSWDPKGGYSGYWGRVGETAISCLCLEVYYRYLPMYKE